ncbi:hypothetical protein JCM10908_000951 [Rhodotorula pacifica]|uniref:uncharacterized protein n=1 Tax=Rhodotorula pacifica TaxID=1495444 RepID=UPI003177C812
MTTGVVFVVLAEGANAGHACGPRLATSGLVIKAGQPYEAALAEVRRHFKVDDDASFACSFAQRFPEMDNSFTVGVSAWDEVKAGTRLEFVVDQIAVKPAPSSPTPEGANMVPEPAGQVGRAAAAISSPVRRNSRQYSPPANPPSWMNSQNSGACIAPATPSGTDTDGQVTDSEAEEDFADQMARSSERHSVRLSPSPDPARPARSRSGTPAEPDRGRSATPSPSNRSADYKIFLHRRLEAERRLEQGLSSESTAEPESSGESGEQDPQSRFAGGSSSAVQCIVEPAIQAPRSEAHGRVGTSSGETDVSLMIGLDANGNVNFVPRSPPRPARGGASAASRATLGRSPAGKGKGRAILPEETASDTEDSAASVKAEILSSQPVRALLRQEVVATPPKPFATALAPSRSLQRADDEPVRPPTPGPSSRGSSTAPPPPSDMSRKRSTPPTSEEAFTPNKQRCVTASRLQREGWVPPAPPTPRNRLAFASPQKTNSASRKHTEDKRREALSRPRVPIPQPGRSERFHYWLRLPNWPIAPRNEGPLAPRYIHKIGARGTITLGLRLEHVFQTMSELSGWRMRDLRATFYTLNDKGHVTPTYVWGWDNVLLGFRDLEEMGMPEAGGLIDFDYIPFDPQRSYLDWE